MSCPGVAPHPPAPPSSTTILPMLPIIPTALAPPPPPRFGDKVVAAIKWVDGTVIDCVREAEIKGTASGG